jgi:hypothetical protein
VGVTGGRGTIGTPALRGGQASRHDELEYLSLYTDKEIDRLDGVLADCPPSIETG